MTEPTLTTPDLNQSASEIQLVEIPELSAKNSLRNAVHEAAGDPESLLGTTADGVQVLLYAFSQLIIAQSQAKTVSEVRAAAEPFKALATGFVDKISSGEVKLPFQAKGLEQVVKDIEQRATAVAEVLAQTDKGATS